MAGGNIFYFTTWNKTENIGGVPSFVKYGNTFFYIGYLYRFRYN